MSAEPVMNLLQIMEFLPHRYPFLLVDRVVELTPGKTIRAYKNVSFNEEFFQGHFPGLPVMPGVLITEAMAQAGGVMILAAFTPEEREGKIFLFAGMDKVRFRKPVYPGDRLDLHCEILGHKLRLWKMAAKAYVDGQLAAEAEISAGMADRRDI
ncbi:MAG: 3-hydroxyacyl-ACP dehydratase FabZ [Desulfovibrionaceae bacterium]|nr:3-hydroxyacyl-ACP dehydratase FabZ [Desulfovibrionaceae bacterium]